MTAYHRVEFVRAGKPYRVDGVSRQDYLITIQDREGSEGRDSEAYATMANGELFRILRWKSNDNVVPSDIMEQARGLFEEPWPFLKEMNAARDEETVQAIKAYKEARARMTPEQLAEEAFERRAAFGPGEEVVDILTGERFKT